MDLLRECSIGIQRRRDLMHAFDTFIGKQENSKKVSEIKLQVTRFWDTEKASEKVWVEEVSSNVLLPLFNTFQCTKISNQQYNTLFSLYRPIEICRSKTVCQSFANFNSVLFFYVVSNIVNEVCYRLRTMQILIKKEKAIGGIITLEQANHNRIHYCPLLNLIINMVCR
jgi:hypothetical protein